MKIAVTGATGYIGQRLIRAARLAGYEVLALSRRPLASPGVVWQAFDLADITPLSLPDDVAIVFHLATETLHIQGHEQIEIAAAKRLLDAAAAIGARFVFISSQTARADAPTAYGRLKWQIEQMTLATGGCVVRPGQVYGGPERALFGTLCALVRRLPVLPAFVPSPNVQPVHVDDLAKALLACSSQIEPTVLRIAEPDGVSFLTFLQAIARGRTNRLPIVIPVPTLLIYAAVMLLGPRLSSRFSLDRLRSLFVLPRMDTKADLQRLSITLRPMSAGITRSGCWRRELFREGHVLLAYVLRMPPPGALVRRYVRAVETLRTGQALRLPYWSQRMPALLALLDGARTFNADFRSELEWRLKAALTLAEATPQGASRFLGMSRSRGWLKNSLLITRAVVMESVRRMAQWVLSPVLARVGRRGAFE